MDYREPDYAAIFTERLAILRDIRMQPERLQDLKDHYRDNPIDFISDWGVTFDPRNVEIGLPGVVPFVLFGKQREWLQWVIDRWRAREPGLTEKSRDVGASWCAVALSCTLCLFNHGMAIGFGSRKEEYVDKIGTLKPLLPKARMFMQYLPEEFSGGFVQWRDAPFMRITFPETGSLITGESGDQIGRGDRSSIYFVDEAAHLERPLLVEASLSQTTNCRIDMSSVNGMNNPFAQKRFGGKVKVFIFDWHDDPRKDEAWYEKQCRELDPVVVAQEIDRDYSASVHGIVIPGVWVKCAIDACEKLGLHPTGQRSLALDVADEGIDKNALCGVTGVQIDYLDEWSGKGSDIYETVQRTFNICDQERYQGFRYDADGLGAGVRGDARIINEIRRNAGAHEHPVEGFRGSEAVYDPEGIVDGTVGQGGDKGRKNKDYFMNRKAQGWWALRRRFQKTHRWLVDGIKCHPDEIISISSKTPLYLHLVAELSQATYAVNPLGKIVINKKPDNTRSPNLADAVMTRFAQTDIGLIPAFTPQQAAQLKAIGRHPRRF